MRYLKQVIQTLRSMFQSNEVDTKKPLLVFILLCLPVLAFANVIWPAYIAESRIISLHIIVISLLIEFLFFKYLFKITIIRALCYTLIANTASTILGLVLRPISGILWELSFGFVINEIFNWGTFNFVTWASVPILGGAVNAFLELLTIKICWKQKLSKKNYFLTWGINAITIAIALVSLLVWPN